MNNEKLLKLPKQVEDIASQLESITQLITPTMSESVIQGLLNNGGRFKFIGEHNINQLIVKSNSVVESDKNSIIKALSTSIPIKVVGKNISVKSLIIDCNKKANCGILVFNDCFNIEVSNNEVFNVYETSKPAYGIYVSALMCKNIKINKNYIHDIVSVKNNTVAIRDGGWTNGIIVDLYDNLFVGQLPIMSERLISKNITISENTVENIGQDNEDSNGIYVEGYSSTYNVNTVISNNTLINCGKRGIKTLPSKNVTITNNTILSNNNFPMHSFISCYGNDEVIKNNVCRVTNSYCSYGIEIGYDRETYGECIINKYVSSNILDLGLTTSSSQYEKSGVSMNLTNTQFGNVEIIGNSISNSNVLVNLSNNYSINLLIIKNNMSDNAVYRGINLTLNKVNKLLLADNIINGITERGISINKQITTSLINYLNIENNIVSNSDLFAFIRGVDNLLVINNKIGSTNAYSIEETNNKTLSGNINTLTNSFTEVKLSDFDFEIISVGTSSFNIDTKNKYKVTKKVLPTVNSILSSIDNSVVGCELCIIPALSSYTITIPHNTDIHLKSGTNAILSGENSITLVKLDNRWVEKCRNF